MNKKQSRFLSLFFTFLILFSFLGDIGVKVKANNQEIEKVEDVNIEEIQNEEDNSKEIQDTNKQDLEVKKDEVKDVKQVEPKIEPKEGFTFEEINGGIKITGYKGNVPSNLNIPSELDGKKVLEIEKHAFQDKEITSLVLPEGLTSIGEYAFADNKIAKLKLPKTLTILGKYAFRDNRIETIESIGSITKINEGVFAGNKLTEVDLSESKVTEVHNKAFINNDIYVNLKGKDVGSYISKTKDYGHVSNTTTVTIKHQDEKGNKVAEDKVVGDDLKKIDGSGILIKNKEFKYEPVILKGYELLSESPLSITTDKDSNEFIVKYKKEMLDLKIDLGNLPVFLEVDSVMDEEKMLSYVKAFDTEGEDISKTLTVLPKKIDTSKMDSEQTVTFTAMDSKGNKISKQHTFIIGEDMMKYPVGGGWVLGDFTYGNENEDINYEKPFATVTGLSVQGKKKLTEKEGILYLPTINPYNKEKITNIDTRIQDKFELLYDNKGNISYDDTFERNYTQDFNEVKILNNLDDIEHIGDYAFYNSGFSGDFYAPKVKTIGERAFYSVNFTGNFNAPELKTIGTLAFYQSKFEGKFKASKVEKIDESVFENSMFTGEFNAPEVTTIGNSAFEYSQFTGYFNAPKVEEIGSFAFYVSVFTGDFNAPKVEKIGMRAFRNSLFTDDFNAPKVEKIGLHAFEKAQFTGDFNAPKVEELGTQVFRYSKFSGDFNAPKVEKIGLHAFEKAQFTGDFNAPNVTTIGDEAFKESKFTGDFNAPKVEEIGNNVFENSFTNDGEHLFNAPKVEKIGKEAFKQSKFSGDFNAPEVKTIGDYAFYKSEFKGDFNAPKIEEILERSFEKSKFKGKFNAPNVSKIDRWVFLESEFTGDFNAPKVKTIGDYAFRDSKFTGSFNVPKVEKISDGAFYHNDFKKIDMIYLPNIKHLGDESFHSFSSDSNDYKFFVGTNIKQVDFKNNVFGFTRDPKVNVTVVNENREIDNPYNLTNGDSFIINGGNPKVPTVVNINYLDLKGEKIIPSEEVILKDEIYKPKFILGYESVEKVIDISNLKSGNSLDIKYKKIDYNNLKKEGVELTQNYGQGDKSHFYIGDNMISKVTLSLTGFNKELKNPKVRIFFGDNIDTSKMNVAKNEMVTKYILGDNYIDVFLPKDNIGGSNFEFILRDFSFKKNETPSDVKEKFLAVLFDSGEAIHASNILDFTGYYNKPYMTKYAKNNEDLIVEDRDNGPRDFGTIKRIPNTTKERVDKEKDVVFYFNTLDYRGFPTLERNISKFIIKDKLPTYIGLNDKGEEEERIAQLSDNNKGWSLSEDGKYVIYESNLFEGTVKPDFPELKLRFPRIKNGYEITNEVEIELIPENKGENEDTMFVSDSIKIYPTDTDKPNPTGEHHFSKHHIKLPRRERNSAYFYDILEDREKEMPYEITFGSLNKTVSLRNVRITDYKLDNRMYFDSLILPVMGDINVSVVAYKRVGDKIDNDKDILLEGYRYNLSKENKVNFQSKDINYFQLVFDENYVLEGKHALRVNARLRNPEKDHYSSVNQFYNDAVLSGINLNKKTGEVFGKRGDLTQDMGDNNLISKYDPMFDNIPGNFFWADRDHIDIKDVSNSVSLRKKQVFYNIDANGNKVGMYLDGSDVNGSSEGKYTLSLNTRDALMFEDYKDFKLVDLLPNELEILDFKLTDEFLNNSTNAKIELIKDYDVFEGQKRDAIIVTADKLDKDTKNILEINVKIKDEIISGVQIKNHAKATWSNDKTLKSGSTETDNNGVKWTTDSRYIQVIDAKMVLSNKRIRNIGGEWKTGIITDSNEAFDYKLTIINKSGQKTQNVEIVDVFPYENDISIQELNPGTNNRPDRESEFANKFDTSRKTIVPKGYTVEYYNSTDIIDYKGKSADDVFNTLNWSTTPDTNTKAIRIKAESGVELKDGEEIEIIVPMKAPDNRDLTLVGKKAWNTFVRKDDTTDRFLEPNRVYNEMLAPKGSITITKYGKKGLLDNLFGGSSPLAGATFEIRNKENIVVDKKVTDKKGQITFKDLDVGQAPFTIKELESPEGYFPSNNALTVTLKDFLDAENYNVIKDTQKLFLNRMPYKGSLILEKKDNIGNLIDNVMFKVTGLDEHNKDVSLTRYTNKDGRIEIKDLIEGRYELEEINTDYQGLGLVPIKPIEFNINSDGKIIDLTGDNSIINDKAMVQINKISVGQSFDLSSIKDIHSWKYDKLSGYAFDLTEEDKETELVFVDNEGKLLKELKLNRTYTIKENIKESIQDKDHAFNDKEYKFKINKYGKVIDENGNEFIENAVNIPNPQTPVYGEIHLTKKGDDGKLLEGAEFTLFDMLGKETDYKGITNNEGKLSITNIEPGAYILKETKAPKGYVNTFKDVFILIDKYSDTEAETVQTEDALIKKFTFNIINPKIEIEFIKGEDIKEFDNLNDALNSKEYRELNLSYRVNDKGKVVLYKPLKDVQFKVTVDGKTKTGLTTDEEGKLDLSDFILTENSKVTIEEIKTLDGYSLDSKPININIGLDSKLNNFTGKIYRYMNNTKLTGTITISKYSTKDKNKLSDVKFGLYVKDNKGDYLPVKDNQGEDVTGITNESGYLYFDNLEYGKHYAVKELETIKGHQIIDTYFEMDKPISSDYTNEHFVIYNPTDKINIQLIKVDGDNTEKKLEGVEFTLYTSKNGKTFEEVLEDGKSITVKSDEKGLVLFKDIDSTLLKENLYVRETKALEGYILQDNYIKVVIEENDSNILEGNIIDLGVVENFKKPVDIIDTGGFATKSMLMITLLLLTSYVFINKKKTNI